MFFCCTSSEWCRAKHMFDGSARFFRFYLHFTIKSRPFTALIKTNTSPDDPEGFHKSQSLWHQHHVAKHDVVWLRMTDAVIQANGVATCTSLWHQLADKQFHSKRSEFSNASVIHLHHVLFRYTYDDIFVFLSRFRWFVRTHLILSDWVVV